MHRASFGAFLFALCACSAATEESSKLDGAVDAGRTDNPLEDVSSEDAETEDATQEDLGPGDTLGDELGIEDSTVSSEDGGALADAAIDADVDAALPGCLRDSDCSGFERCDQTLAECVDCSGPDCWRSTLYPADWAPSTTDSEGRFLHDFSYAGYGAGVEAVPAPVGPLFDVTSYGSGPEWRAAIQLAIDDAQAAGGGVVYFPPGTYRVDGVIRVQSSNVVLRGGGATTSRVYFSTSIGMTDHAHIEIGTTPSYGAERMLTADAPNRSDVVEVADAADFAVGDQVAVGWVVTEAFRADHGMSAYWGFAAGQWRAFFRRTVVAIDTATPGMHRVYLDVPLRYAALVRDQASLRAVTGLIQDVGLEDLGLSNAVAQSAAQNEDRVSLVTLQGVSDAWVRRVQTFSSPLSGPGTGVFHVQSHGLSVINSRRVTVEDVSIGRAQDRGSGGNGYLIEMSRSSEVLVQRATLRDGRHNFCFNWDFGNSGIVIRDSDSEGSHCDGALVTCRNELHHSLAMAVLIENSRIVDGWVGGNRRAESSGAGHTATESVFWRNYDADHIYSWQYGAGYLIGNEIAEHHTELADTSVAGWELQWFPYWLLNSNGHTSLGTEPEDTVEGAGQRDTLRPASLYLDQLERRLAR